MPMRQDWLRGDENAAAVAGKKAGEVFGLTVCAENIEDDPNNTTRFLVIAAQEVAASGKDKTSLVMSVKNRPGAIYELLAPLARHGVSMSPPGVSAFTRQSMGIRILCGYRGSQAGCKNCDSAGRTAGESGIL